MTSYQALSKSAVQAALRTKWIGRSFHFFDSIGSTNLFLKAQLSAPHGAFIPAGAVYLTDYQHDGRGRLSRRWEAPPGTSLLLSVLFRPPWPVQQTNWLTMMAALAAAEAIESQASLKIAVKWPNDLMILVDKVWHKVGGILLEGDLAEDGRFRSVILGIGINVNILPTDLPQAVTPAASLFMAGGKPVPRLPLLCAFLARLEAIYDAALQGQSPQPAWQERLMMLGQPVQVSSASSDLSIKGIAVGTDAWGQLLVQDETGVLQTIAAGDVTLREAQ